MSSEASYCRSASAVWRSTATAVITAATGTDVLVLTATAPAVWAELEAPITLRTLVDRLAARFDADPAVITHDVEAMLRQLVDAGVVTSTNE